MPPPPPSYVQPPNLTAPSIIIQIQPIACTISIGLSNDFSPLIPRCSCCTQLMPYPAPLDATWRPVAQLVVLRGEARDPPRRAAHAGPRSHRGADRKPWVVRLWAWSAAVCPIPNPSLNSPSPSLSLGLPVPVLALPLLALNAHSEPYPLLLVPGWACLSALPQIEPSISTPNSILNT